MANELGPAPIEAGKRTKEKFKPYYPTGIGTLDLTKLTDDAWLNNYLQKQMEYEFPEEELGRRMNIFGRQMTAQEQNQMRSYQESFAGRTGGRMSSARGGAEIGGQNALARATGQAQIMMQAFQQEFAQRQSALNAYIQKYGVDEQAKIAMEQLEAQRDQYESQMYGDILGTLTMLPFLL